MKTKDYDKYRIVQYAPDEFHVESAAYLGNGLTPWWMRHRFNHPGYRTEGLARAEITRLLEAERCHTEKMERERREVERRRAGFEARVVAVFNEEFQERAEALGD